MNSPLPQPGDDIVVSMQPPARKYTCRMIVDTIIVFGSLVLVSGPEFKLDGTKTSRRKSQLRLDLATWKAA